MTQATCLGFPLCCLAACSGSGALGCGATSFGAFLAEIERYMAGNSIHQGKRSLTRPVSHNDARGSPGRQSIEIHRSVRQRRLWGRPPAPRNPVAP